MLLFNCLYDASAQTLFTYGKHAVSKEEFLRAYNKNYSDTSGARISYEEYLELYARFKLKVQSALDARMDTTAEQKAEVQSFRHQLAENYLKDEASLNLLVDEAFQRSLKDIDVSYIFAPIYSPDASEVETAKKKIDEAHSRLKAGEAWDKVAESYDHGDPGYITVFVLPYTLENAAYTTSSGKYSAPVRAGKGYFIIRNNGERKAVGQIRIAQILLAFRPNMDDSSRHRLRERADSLHYDLLEGGIFKDSAKAYSNDNLTYLNGGEMPAFGLGEYDTAFTNAAFALRKDGDISSPVKTSYGFHILQRIQKIDVIEDKNNEANRAMLTEKVLQSDRMQAARAMLVKNIRQKIAKDADAANLESDSAVIAYYRNNLEKYDATFADQLKEFKEGNLLFGIMQKKIWDAATADTAALRSYFSANRQKYNWDISADAIIVTSTDAQILDSIQAVMKANPAAWRSLVENSNGTLQADSGRFELGQIPVVERTNFSEGLFTAPVISEQDSSRTFAYIIRMHNEKEPKEFEDAKGAVINDYQVYLEEQWVADLKKKYPVKVNKKVFRSLVPKAG